MMLKFSSRLFVGLAFDSGELQEALLEALTETEAVENIMAAIQEKAGLNSPANGICFIMPVEKCLIKQ